MSEELEDRSLGDTEDEFCKCGKSKIKYTRPLLLEFTELEVCRKLPGDFDLLNLRELDGASTCTTDQKSISCSSLCGPVPSSGWDFGLPNVRLDNDLLLPSKKSLSHRNYYPERREVIYLLQESGYDAGIWSQKIQKSDPFQLEKSEQPYRRPRKKMLQPLDTISEDSKESSEKSSHSPIENGQLDSVDGVTGTESSGHDFPFGQADDFINFPVGESEARCSNAKESGKIDVNDNSELGVKEDFRLEFDDLWAETLRILHDDSLDSEFKVCLPNDGSVILADITESSNSSNLDNGGDVTSFEDDIILPDEESLITLEDMIGPYRMSKLDLALDNHDDMTSDTTVYNWGSPHEVTHRKLRCRLSHSQTSSDKLSPAINPRKDQMSYLEKLVKPNVIQSTPTLNSYTCSYFHDQTFLKTSVSKTKTEDSLVSYSMFQQPKICPQQENRLLIDPKCPNPIKPIAAPDLNTMRQFPWTSTQAAHESSGKSNAAATDPAAKGGSGRHKSRGKLYSEALVSCGGPLSRVQKPEFVVLPVRRSI